MEHKKHFNVLIKKIESIEKILNKPSLDDYISEYDARMKFKKGKTWFFNLRKSGFPYHKLKGEVFYKKQDFIDYLEGDQ